MILSKVISRVADSCDHMNKVNQSINGNTKGCEECEKNRI
jgi:hypothetical protein